MQEQRVINDVELLKIMLDPRRMQILRFAQDEPITVKQMAEIMDEKPSRLYYHVKKLEEAGLLELVETKQQGNLIEKYYLANQEKRSYTLGKELSQEHSSLIVQELLRITHQGIDVIEDGMRKGQYGEDLLAEAKIAYSSMTPMEWAEKAYYVQQATSANYTPPPFNPDESSIANDEQLREQTTKDEYVFVMLSYRLKDVPNRESVDGNENMNHD